ncbi:MAG TPA: AMP-binding protein, partial [Gemmataceae bacterium]
MRRTLNNWSIRVNAKRAAQLRGQGWWTDETIAEVAERKAKSDPRALLLVDGQRRLDAQTLFEEARCIAHSFIARGLSPGDVISIMLPNWHEAAVIYLGATLAGVVVNLVVPSLRDSEITFMFEDIDSKIVFIPSVFRSFDYVAMMRRVNDTLSRPAEVVVVRGQGEGCTPYQSLLAQTAPSAPLPHVDPDSVKIVLYTSGTTARPKGVLHSHNSIHALVRQLHRHWVPNGQGRFFVPSPIGHIGGSIYAFEFPYLVGSTAVLQDVWNADDAVAIMLRERCTHMAGATPFLKQLLQAARKQGTRLPDLSLFICGGASVAPGLIREASAYFENCVVTRVFGSTEVPVITVGSLTRDDLYHAAESDGKIGIAQVKLVDQRGQIGEEGEVLARGPQMLIGYIWIEHELESFDADGFFKTGDIAKRMDGDYLVITGRAKDIIIRNGENISPKEIEDLLTEHPDIAEVTVVG